MMVVDTSRFQLGGLESFAVVIEIKRQNPLWYKTVTLPNSPLRISLSVIALIATSLLAGCASPEEKPHRVSTEVHKMGILSDMDSGDRALSFALVYQPGFADADSADRRSRPRPPPVG